MPLAAQPQAGGEAPTILLGDSITYFWTDLPSDWPVHNYVNKGVPAQTSAQVLARFGADVVALHPRMVVILVGANDVAQGVDPHTLANNIQSMVHSAKANDIQVVVCTITPFADPRNDIVQADNVYVRAVAQQEGVPLADYYAAMVDDHGIKPGLLLADGVHLTPAGYAIIGAVLKPLL